MSDANNSRSSIRTWKDEQSVAIRASNAVRSFLAPVVPAAAIRVDKTNPNDPRAFGIDLSNWNGAVDFQVVKTYVPKIVFAGFRLSLGATYRDPRFEVNYTGAGQIGLMRIVYHYFYPEVSVKTQIDLVASALAGNRPEIGVSPDLEYTDGLSNAEVARVSESFCKGLEDRLGQNVVIYSRKYYIDPIFNGAAWLSDFDWWIAHYTADGSEKTDPTVLIPNGIPPYTIHQSESKGSIPGVESLDVDHNRWNGTAADLYRYCGITPGPVEPTDAEKLRRLWVAHPELW